MRRWSRRLVCLTTLAGISAAVLLFLQNRRAAGQVAEPVWPPVTPDDKVRPFAPVTTTPIPAQQSPTQSDSAQTSQQRWVAAVDGACPGGYPIKANESSGIFHVPGGRFYNRTIPERCYAKADDAVSDGYRAAKA